MTDGDAPRAPSPVAALFDAVADDYDQTGIDFFGPIATGLVAELDPRPGESCGGLGCGRGAVTRSPITIATTSSDARCE